MTTMDIDQSIAATVLDQGVQDLVAENKMLRDYLKRVLKVLEAKVPEPVPAPELVDHPHPIYVHTSEPAMSLAEVQDGLRRVEDNLDRLMRLISRQDDPVIILAD